VHERTAQQELIAEAQTIGLVTRGRRQEAQSGSKRINEGQGGQKETSQYNTTMQNFLFIPIKVYKQNGSLVESNIGRCKTNFVNKGL
jgi:hypothetical protein